MRVLITRMLVVALVFALLLTLSLFGATQVLTASKAKVVPSLNTWNPNPRPDLPIPDIATWNPNPRPDLPIPDIATWNPNPRPDLPIPDIN